MPEFHAGFMAAWKARWPHNFLHPDALETYGLESSYFASATYDERFRKINDAVLYLLSRPFLPTRLEDCSLMAASYGVEYSWPLLDQRLVQQWLTTPAVWKVGDGCIGRYLHRRAIDGVCADKVTWKASKDMGFAAVSSVAETADNRPLFRKALQLMDSVPPALAMIVDVARVRSMADRGIRQDCRGQAVRMAWSANIRQFELLEIWLRKS
jgi:asparagine synthase (glutamine-hydrolysing)